MFEAVMVTSPAERTQSIEEQNRVLKLLAYGLERLLSGACQVAESDLWDVATPGHQSGTTTCPQTGQEVAA
jgi:hypothetical protein